MLTFGFIEIFFLLFFSPPGRCFGNHAEEKNVDFRDDWNTGGGGVLGFVEVEKSDVSMCVKSCK